MSEDERNVNEDQSANAAGGASDGGAEEPGLEQPSEPAGVDAPTGAPGARGPGDEPSELSALGPKERRRRRRSRHRGEAKRQRSPEERAAERAEARTRKARERRRWRRRIRDRRASEPRGETPAPAREKTGRPRVRQGVVVSDRSDKTITVRVDVQRPHRVYGKIVRTSSTLHAHDEGNEAHAGDRVRVVESRPLSRTKRWRLVEVVERAR